jgi:cytochrome c556
MRIAVLSAVASVALLAGCSQGTESATNNSALAEAETNGAVPAPIPAAAPVGPDEARKLFHERHEGMEDIGKSNKAIAQQLKSDSPDLEVIRKAAATINELAPKSANWFPAGTNKDVLPKTRALPAIWERPDDFVAKDRDFQKAAAEFNAAAAGGDLEAIKSQFATLGKACKACHDTYRAEEHPK